jgi:hypothetical protein
LTLVHQAQFLLREAIPVKLANYGNSGWEGAVFLVATTMTGALKFLVNHTRAEPRPFRFGKV